MDQEQKSSVPLAEWSEDDNHDWIAQWNIFGLAVIAFCAPRLIHRIESWSWFTPPGPAILEFMLFLYILHVGHDTIFARHKKTRSQVPHMTKGKGPMIVGVIVSLLYVVVLAIEIEYGRKALNAPMKKDEFSPAAVSRDA